MFKIGGKNPKNFALEKSKLEDVFSNFPTGLAQEIHKGDIIIEMRS